MIPPCGGMTPPCGGTAAPHGAMNRWCGGTNAPHGPTSAPYGGNIPRYGRTVPRCGGMSAPHGATIRRCGAVIAPSKRDNGTRNLSRPNPERRLRLRYGCRRRESEERPNAECRMPNAECRMPNAEGRRPNMATGCVPVLKAARTMRRNFFALQEVNFLRAKIGVAHPKSSLTRPCRLDSFFTDRDAWHSSSGGRAEFFSSATPLHWF
jgi:hypothetical protein